MWMETRMRLIFVVLLASLSGCAGGSGSSGFDIGFAEDAAIAEALLTQRCNAVGGKSALTVCPANTGMPADIPGVVEVAFDPDHGAACDPSIPDRCAFEIPFLAAGLPAATSFRVATRTLDPPGRWHISDRVAVSATGTPLSDPLVALDAPRPESQAARRIQIAVLAFRQVGHDVPVEVNHLSDTGADYAFVIESSLLLAGVVP